MDDRIAQTSPLPPDDPQKKPPVVRGARACTVCRAAKMKCVGAEDGKQPCQRCRRTNLECIFEKHRRGRKPGSKLSEASKMLRRFEKGLSTAKAKSHAESTAALSSPDPRPDASSQRLRPGDPFSSPSGAFSTNELPPLKLPPDYNGDNNNDPHYGSRSDDDDDDGEADPFPAKLISRENQRQPFFKTILNPESEPPATASHRASAAPPTSSSSWSHDSSPPPPSTIQDPVAAGIVDEANAKVLFDLVFLRLNPFINLFDPALHSVTYVRKRSPFLFTTLLMAGCKFFKPESYKACQKIANEFAVRAFVEGWKSVEVVQAFACLCYWKEPEDTRTWQFIGFACRMAVEIGLNKYYPTRPPHETEFQRRERRNRERTYLVLFVHDRSLSTQTGRSWMLPEDDLVRNANTWHELGGDGPMRPEDVIVAAFVQLRRITAETTEVFYMQRGANEYGDMNKEVLLRNCNSKLTQWMETWQGEMRRANGETFHIAFLRFFRLYVRLFLNSFGIQGSMSNQTRTTPSLQALSACYTSAVEILQIVSNEFAKMSMLRYGQDSITVMTAYGAVFLLRLLRSSNTLAGLHEGATDEIHSIISKTADAYEEAASFSSACTGAAYHARFLRGLVAQDIFKARQTQQVQTKSPVAPGLPSPSTSTYSRSSVGSYPGPSSARRPDAPMYPPEQGDMSYSPPNMQQHPHTHNPPSFAHGAMPMEGQGAYGYPPTGQQPPQQQGDMMYWNNMFRDLGFGQTVDATYANGAPTVGASSGGSGGSGSGAAVPLGYPGAQSGGPTRQMGMGAYASGYAYQYMHSDAPGYGS